MPIAPPRAPSPPDWLTEPLDKACRLGAVVTGLFALLLVVDLVSASRPWVPGWLAALEGLFATASAVLLAMRHRAGLLTLVGLGLVSALASRGEVPGDLWLLWAGVGLAASGVAVSLGSAGAFRFVLCAAVGLGGLTIEAPVLLDGVLQRPLFAIARSQRRGVLGAPVTGPFIDQRTGLQLDLVGRHLREDRRSASDTALIDPELDLGVRFTTLSGDSPLSRVTDEGVAWLRDLGFTSVVMGDARAEAGGFDAAARLPFTATHGRRRVEGLLVVGTSGSSAFAIAAVAPRHRATLADLNGLVASARYRPAARPMLDEAQRAVLAPALVWSDRGADVRGVVVSSLESAALLWPAADSSQAWSTAVGPLEATAVRGELTAGVLAVPLAHPTSRLRLRSFTAAPALSRVVVAGKGFRGGWLTDAPGHAIRAIDLESPTTGPAFDLTGALVGLVVPQGEGLGLVTLDALATTLTRLNRQPPDLEPAATEAPPPLYAAGEDEHLDESVEARLKEAVVLVAGAVTTAALVSSQRDDQWVLLLDAAALAPGARGFAVRMPDGSSRGAEVARIFNGVAVATLPSSPDDGLVSPLMSDLGEAQGVRLAVGYSVSTALSTPAIRILPGRLSSEGFEGVPSTTISGGPVFTRDGRVSGLRLANGRDVVRVDQLRETSATGFRDVVWRVAFDAAGLCHLAADIELEDPLQSATLVKVRIEPGTPTDLDAPAPVRLTAASLTDALPKQGLATVSHIFPCFVAPQRIQFEVQSPTGSVVTVQQALTVPDELPGISRGRTNGSPGAGPASLALTAQLWSAPPQKRHPCQDKPALCERACLIDELDACTPDGLYAMLTGEVQRAAIRFDRQCARGELEACVLLPWALDRQQRAQPLTSKPEPVLKRWCDAGYARACAAMNPAEWKQLLPTATAACARSPSGCALLGRLLLKGPRWPDDLQKAAKAFNKACAAGDGSACGEAADTALRFELEPPAAVMDRAQQACAAGSPRACMIAAMNPALGLTVPRSPQAAQAALEKACALGSGAACAMTTRR